MEINKHTHIDDDLLEMLQQEFNEEDKAMFLDSFKVYLTYDSKKDFVINCDDIWDWLGFANKGNLKQLVLKNLSTNVHFVTKLASAAPKASCNNKHGGHNKENILLTVQAFKQLCMAANTEKAKQIREYYIKMEEVMLEYTKKKLLDADREKSMLKNQLLKHKAKTYEEVIKNEYIYINKENTEADNNIHKIGRAIDTNKRLAQHNTASAKGVVELYKRATCNAVICEKVIHTVLKKYSFCGSGGTEHFNCDITYSKHIVDLVCTFVDTLLGTYEFINNEQLLEIIGKKIGTTNTKPVSNDKKKTTKHSYAQCEFITTKHSYAQCDFPTIEDSATENPSETPIRYTQEMIEDIKKKIFPNGFYEFKESVKPSKCSWFKDAELPICDIHINWKAPWTGTIITNTIINRIDIIGDWLRKRFVRTTDINDVIYSSALYRKYIKDTEFSFITREKFFDSLSNLHCFPTRRTKAGYMFFCCIKKGVYIKGLGVVAE
jgi:phage anti-repressor protein